MGTDSPHSISMTNDHPNAKTLFLAILTGGDNPVVVYRSVVERMGRKGKGVSWRAPTAERDFQ